MTERAGPASLMTRPPESADLFEQHLALADRLARRYAFGPGVDEDLQQVARLGLHLAAQRFDPDLGVFVRFATVTIVGELKKHLRSHGWGVHVPRPLQEDSITVAAAVDRLTGRLGRAPTVSELADHTGRDRERVVEALRVRDARFSSSLAAAGDRPEQTNTADRAIVAVALDDLADDERELIRWRFEDGLTQSEIGERIGISQPQVHRRLSRAIEALRERLTDR